MVLVVEVGCGSGDLLARVSDVGAGNFSDCSGCPEIVSSGEGEEDSRAGVAGAEVGSGVEVMVAVKALRKCSSESGRLHAAVSCFLQPLTRPISLRSSPAILPFEVSFLVDADLLNVRREGNL